MKYGIKLEYKGHKIEVKDAELFIDGACHWPYKVAQHDLLGNKLFVCKVYDALLNEIRSTPKRYFKGLAFGPLVDALKHIVATDYFLRTFRRLNCEGNYREFDEKISEEVTRACREAIAMDYENKKKFSKPELWTLRIISGGVSDDDKPAIEAHRDYYYGSEVDTNDLENLYDAVNDDDTKLNALLKEFEKFPFTRYITARQASLVMTKLSEHEGNVRAGITAFLKMRAVAGDDVVNWGPHKWASQVKRHGVKNAWCASHWLLNDVKNHLIKKGIKPTERKKSKAESLGERYSTLVQAEMQKPESERECVEFSQEDLIALFKNATESKAPEYVRLMTAETAVSLLDCTTKNVIAKLYSTRGFADRGSLTHTACPALNSIVARVAHHGEPIHFQRLMTFLKDKGLISCITWRLLLKHAGQYTTKQFVEYASHLRSDYRRSNTLGIEGQTHLDREFFDKVVSKVKPTERYYINAQVTDAFLRYFANDGEKICVMNDDWGQSDKRVCLDWELSAIHFQTLPYDEIQKFLEGQDTSGDLIIDNAWEYFQDLIVKNQDKDTACAVLLSDRTGDTYEAPYQFFQLFDYEAKVEILDNTARGHLEIRRVLNATELNEFARVALTKENLAKYIDDLPVKNLNEHIKIVDVTARVTETDLFLPLTEKIVKALNKDSARRVLARAQFVGESQYESSVIPLKQRLFKKLTRAEVIEVVGVPLPEIQDYTRLAAVVDFMTPAEIMQAAERSDKFLRNYLDRIPDSYVKRFQDKELLKQTVGNRVNRGNKEFGKALEARLERLAQAA